MGILVRDLLRRSKVPGASELGFTLQPGKWFLSQPWSLHIQRFSNDADAYRL